MKIIVLLFILVILGSLGCALFYLVKDRGQSDRTVKALTVRIAVSAAVHPAQAGFYFGLIPTQNRNPKSPHGGKAMRLNCLRVESVVGACYSQYTRTNNSNHTTSTKCQYQDTASKPKWLSGLKCPASDRKKITVSMMTPSVTWKPWKPVSM